jgi:hypothetical protein
MKRLGRPTDSFFLVADLDRAEVFGPTSMNVNDHRATDHRHALPVRVSDRRLLFSSSIGHRRC